MFCDIWKAAIGGCFVKKVILVADKAVRLIWSYINQHSYVNQHLLMRFSSLKKKCLNLTALSATKITFFTKHPPMAAFLRIFYKNTSQEIRNPALPLLKDFGCSIYVLSKTGTSNCSSFVYKSWMRIFS